MARKKRRMVNLHNAKSQAYTGTQELIDSEEGLVRYSTEIVRKFFSKLDLENRIVRNGGTLLEFGAGIGFLADIFRTSFQILPECVELDLNLVAHIESRGFKCFQFLKETKQDYAAIYSSNVLEHIEDDSATLSELFKSLIPGGVIGIYVPAHPFLYSSMDAEIGHVRRYKRSELRDKVIAAGFEIQSLTYDESIGFLASALVKIVGYKNQANLGSKNSLIFYDKFIYPISRVLDRLGFRYIIGKNLILVATKQIPLSPNSPIPRRPI